MTAQKTIQPVRPNAKVAVTDRALAAVADLRKLEHARADQAIGVIPTAGGGVGLVLDVPGPTDRVFLQDDQPVLYVAADMERRLRGRVLDFEGPAGKERFTLERPLAEDAIGLAGPDLTNSGAFATFPREVQMMTDESGTQVAEDTAIGNMVELVDDKRPDGFGFHLRVLATGRLYRIEPARDPRQPRFWCFKVYRCLPSRLVDITQRSWFGAGGMTRDELPAATEAIKADPNGWLETQELLPLRRWIFEEDHDPEGDADFWT
jgi:Fe-S cluster assembly iron-binding protein IscA